MKHALTRRLSILVLLLSPCCVNIYVQFPETAIEEAAEGIVDEVRPEDRSTAPESGGKGPARAKPSEKKGRPSSPKTSGFILSFFRPRYALAETASPDPAEKDTKGKKKFKVNVSTPVIKKIIGALKRRYPKLAPLYHKGAVGEGKDGYLALRSVKDLSLKEKRDVQLLQKQENNDRRNLYTKIAEANRIDHKFVAEIGTTFSRKWQEKSKPGWWIQGNDGKWKKKPEPRKRG